MSDGSRAVVTDGSGAVVATLGAACRTGGGERDLDPLHATLLGPRCPTSRLHQVPPQTCPCESGFPWIHHWRLSQETSHGSGQQQWSTEVAGLPPLSPLLLHPQMREESPDQGLDGCGLTTLHLVTSFTFILRTHVDRSRYVPRIQVSSRARMNLCIKHKRGFSLKHTCTMLRNASKMGTSSALLGPSPGAASSAQPSFSVQDALPSVGHVAPSE